MSSHPSRSHPGVQLLIDIMRADPRWRQTQETNRPRQYIRPPRNELTPPPDYRENEDVILDFGEDDSQSVVPEEEDTADLDGLDSFGNVRNEEDGEQPEAAEEPARPEETTAENPLIAPDDASETSSNDYDPDIDPKGWARRLDELAGVNEMNERELDSYRWGPPAFDHMPEPSHAEFKRAIMGYLDDTDWKYNLPPALPPIGRDTETGTVIEPIGIRASGWTGEDIVIVGEDEDGPGGEAV